VGVSRQTVSAVINDKPGITEATRQRVREAVAQLGYRPDLTARSLRTRQTHTLAIILTDVSSPVAGRMAISAESIAYQAGYSSLLFNTCDDVQRENFYVNSILQRSVDGVAYVSARDESSVPTLLQEAGIPVVVIDRAPLAYSGPSVVLDNREAGRLAGEHLLALGHRHIAHIGGPSYVHISAERLAGLEMAVQATEGPVHVLREKAETWRIESGYQATLRLLSRDASFSALFAAGDLLAIGAMRALREGGRRIPDDVSVIGLDDVEIASYLDPPLTTVSQSIATMAETAMQLLLDIVRGNPIAQTQITVQPRIVVRASTRSVVAV